jgi:hypothetical protein
VIELVVPAYFKVKLWRIESTRFSSAEAAEDLAFLKESLYTRHPRPFQFTSKQAFDALFDHTLTSFEGSISRRELVQKLAPLIAAIKCGHSSIMHSRSFRPALIKGGELMPLMIVNLDGRLFVYQVYTSREAPPPGCEIVAINGRSAADIRDTIMSCLSGDGENQQTAINKMNLMFPFQYYVFVDNGDRFEICVHRPQTADEATFVVDALPAQQVIDEYLRQNPENNVLTEPPTFHSVLQPQQQAAYLRIASFNPPSDWEQYLQGFFRKLREEQITSLVLDLRGNTGGRPYLAVELLRHLLHEPFRYLDASEDQVEMFTDFGYTTFYEPFTPRQDRGFQDQGRLYVLIDGGCFSQTGQVCSMLEAHHVATFIGEETGGGFSCNDNSTVLTLPNSGLDFRLATFAFETSAHGLARGRGILPDIEIKTTIDDLITGRDPVLRWIDQHLGTNLEQAVGCNQRPAI